MRSHLGKLEINGIQVEIMGDIQKRAADGRWDEPPRLEQNKQWVVFDGLRLPVLALEYEYRAYLQMGRLEKAEQIRLRFGEPITPCIFPLPPPTCIKNLLKTCWA